MKVSKWVDFGQEVEIEIGMKDVCCALAESFAAVTQDRLGEPGPTPGEVRRAFNIIATFLNAVKPEHIALMEPNQRKVIREYLEKQPERFHD